VLCGNYAGIVGPIVDPNTDVRYLDVALAQGRSFTYELDANMAAFVYSFEGSGSIGEKPIPSRDYRPARLSP